MTIRRAVFAPSGLGPLALAPQAFGASFDVVSMILPLAPDQAAPPRDPVQVVPVRGPLMHHLDADFGSYEGLLSVVRAEIALGTKALIIAYDTPGGLVSGVFETARTIRDECKAAGVQLVSYVGSQCCSAGYALACSAGLIVAPPASTSGSIGVIEALQDATRQHSMMGLSFTLIASGARKTDGNPMVGISKEAIAARQTHVDDLAGEFFEWVAQNRPLTAENVRALEAGSFAGKRALALRLVDRVQDLEALKKELARALKAQDDQERKPPAALATATEDPKGPPKMSAARKALQAICDDDKASDEDKKEAATALEALGDDDSDDGDKKPDAKAEDGEDDDEKKKDEDEAKAAAAKNPLLSLAAENATLKATRGAGSAKEQVAQLLATRPDFTPELKAALASATPGVVRHYLRTISKPGAQSPIEGARAALASGSTPKPTPAASNAGGPRQSQPAAAQASVPSASGLVTDLGHIQTFSVVKPRPARPSNGA